MINPEDEGTFSITFKTTNEGYNYIRNWINAHTEIISDSILPNTEKLYQEDETFRNIVKEIKNLNNRKLEYINKNN